MRLGLNGEYMITDRLKIMGDIAWLPVSNLTAHDNHWLRASINPLKQVGDSSKNYQLEAVLSYKVTEKVSLGVGARHWHFEASGHTQFLGATSTSPMKFKSDRTTIFTQLSYTFGGEKASGVLGK
jgi:outer membrane scaffolding protein for murein synthesis (MipA/OmpV family)